MSADEPSLALVELRSVQARQRLAGTLGEIQARLNPKALAREAAQELRDAGENLAHEGLQAARRHPLTIAGVVAAIGLFAARRPIRRLFTRAKDETPSKSPRSNTKTRKQGIS
jgi:hypothetical protein